MKREFRNSITNALIKTKSGFITRFFCMHHWLSTDIVLNVSLVDLGWKRNTFYCVKCGKKKVLNPNKIIEEPAYITRYGSFTNTHIIREK